MQDLFEEIIDRVEYDFCEDDDEIQGNWKITRVGNIVTIKYLPYGVSPFPAKTMAYRVERIS
jgi:hypothetical protein